MPDPINPNDSEETVRTKIQDILTFNSITSTGISSWGVARTRLNSAATYLNLPIFTNRESGASVRVKINNIASSPASSAPANTALPTISGNNASGQVLTATNGSWTGYPASFTYSLQWKSDGVNISGETGQTLTLTDAHAGKAISVTVIAQNSRGSSSPVTSGPTAIIRPSWLPSGFNIFADFTTANRFWNNNLSNISSIISDTHAQPILQPDASGGFTNVPVNFPSIGPLGLQTVPTRSNGVRNNSMSGATIGAPGTLPNNWTTGGNAGLTREVIATGTEIGLPYVDVRYFGTTTATVLAIALDAVTTNTAVTGEVWTGHARAKLLVNAESNVPSFAFRQTEHDSAAATLATSTATYQALDGTVKISESTRTLNQATTTHVRPWFVLNFVTGNVYDFTVRIYSPQYEKGEFYTPPILSTNTILTRAGNQPVISDMSGTLDMGFGFVIKFNLPALSTDASIKRILQLSDGTANNRIHIFRPSSSNNLSFAGMAGGVSLTGMPALFSSAYTIGQNIIYGVVGPGYARWGKVGGTDSVQTTPSAYPSGMNQISLLSSGYTSTDNSYGLTSLFALEYGSANDTLFQKMKTMASTL